MPMWVIYDNPKDFPGMFVVRKHWIANGDHWPTADYFTAVCLEEARHGILARDPNVICIPRMQEDDPVIVECWL